MTACHRLLLALALAALAATVALAATELIVNGDFEAFTSGAALRRDDKGQDWRESRGDTETGTRLLMLSTRDIAGNATKKAMIKGHPELNTYLTQRFADQRETFTASWDICVRELLPDDNRSAFCFVGTSSDRKNGPNSTGTERFVFLGFENSATAPGKINLFAREDQEGWGEKTLLARDLDLMHWYTVHVEVNAPKRTYTVQVDDRPASATLKAFRTSKKKAPRTLDQISFASWNDGAGTFYVDNVSVQSP